MVAKNVLRDPKIPAASKGLYAYLSGFAGNSDECYPSISLICAEMAMTKTSIYKYMNILVNAGVVERKQTYNGNLKGKVIYRITDTDYITRFPNFQETIKQESMVSENMRIRESENPTDEETNNNSINNNSINNNSINSTVCSEPETVSEPSGIKIPLNDKTFYDVPKEKIEFWEEIYPAVNIEQELKKMVAWCDANPTKRKTRRGIERFINSWLSKEQDRGGSGRPYQNSNNQNRQQDKPFYVVEEPEYLKYLNTELTPEEKAILGEE